MKRTPVCKEMVKMFEGLKLGAYSDPVGVQTIGYGHVVKLGEGLGPYLADPEEAERILGEDLDRTEVGVEGLVGDLNCTPWEMDALVSFAFNVGVGALGKSTLLRCIQCKDRRAAAAEFAKWKFAGGKPLPGLVKRRRAEAVRFLGGDFPLVAGCYHGGGD